MKTKSIKRWPASYLLAALVIILSASCVKPTSQTTWPITTNFQASIDSIFAQHQNAKGIMVHVESPENGISWSGAAGYSNFEKKTTLKPDQPALIASSIKTHMAAAILKLVEQDKLTIQQPIAELLTPATAALFIEDGYNLEEIQIQHLLSHTSGIEDYISSSNVGGYLDFISENKQYRWTRAKQLQRTVEKGDPLGPPATIFNYADANFLLLAEIIEKTTGKPYNQAFKELLNYEAIGLNDTYFPTLGPKPKGTKPLVHQYWGDKGWDSYDIDPSFDLYGGGGIACTTEDLAEFSYHFFNGNIVKDAAIKDLIYTEISTPQFEVNPYYLGLGRDSHNGHIAYGHGGFWGTVVMYYPDFDASVAVYILERDERALRKDVLLAITKILEKSN